jgi:hypothetical protein
MANEVVVAWRETPGLPCQQGRSSSPAGRQESILGTGTPGLGGALAVDPDALAAELRSLRRGRATLHPALVERLGPQTMRLCGITEDDGPAAARRKIADVIDLLLRGQPDEVRFVITAALALNRESDQRFLRDREHWLARQLNCHERTARRRVDDAIELLVRLATESDHDRNDRFESDAWRVQSLSAFLRLDGPSPELTEHRTVLIVKGIVNDIVTRFSLPRATAGTEESHELVTDILYGGRIRDRERFSEEHFRYTIELPHGFRQGETHEYGIRFRIPPRQAMAPHYALVPLLTVKSLDLRIRFDPDRPPARIWRFDGAAPRMIDNPPSKVDSILHPDRLGEVHLSFRSLRQGFGYGVRWEPSDHG